jgi:hypothetical protein
MAIRPKEFDRGNIYLSGGMQFAKNLGAGWRLEVAKKLKELEYFPLDITDLDIAYNKLHGKPILPTPGQEPESYKANMRKHFIETDLRLIRENSDALIVYYDESARRGAGTVSEAQYAYNLNIPIFLVTDHKNMDEFYGDVSGWLIALSTAQFLSFDSLYEYLEKLPHGIIKKDIYGNHGVNGKYLCHLSGEVFQKKKNKFVSEVKPLYSQKSVDVVHDIYENHKDRYDFFMEYLTKETGAPFKHD